MEFNQCLWPCQHCLNFSIEKVKVIEGSTFGLIDNQVSCLQNRHGLSVCKKMIAMSLVQEDCLKLLSVTFGAYFMNLRMLERERQYFIMKDQSWLDLCLPLPTGHDHILFILFIKTQGGSKLIG